MQEPISHTHRLHCGVVHARAMIEGRDAGRSAVAYQVILEPGILGQFREFESPRVHTGKIFAGTVVTCTN